MLAFRNITCTTGAPRYLRIFEGASLEIPPGRHSILYGDNGSGKSTLVKLMLNKVPAATGTVEGGGLVSCCFEDIESQLFFSTVTEELKAARSRNTLLESVLLEGLLGKSILELSYSEKARVAFAGACLSGRDYLIADSPPSDPRIEEALGIIVERNLKTVLLLLPEGERRDLRGEWKNYVIKDRKICDLKK